MAAWAACTSSPRLISDGLTRCSNARQIVLWSGALEAKYTDLDDDTDPDGAKGDALNARWEELDAAKRAVTADAPAVYAEATKAAGTASLILDADGQVRREYRVRRPRPGAANPGGPGPSGDAATPAVPQPPTSDDLREGQLAATFTHQALGVRRALLADPAARRRVLAMILHDRVRSEALAVRHDGNGTTLHADGFASAAQDALRQRRAEVDPLHDRGLVSDAEAYATLSALPAERLDALIDLLTVECVTAQRGLTRSASGSASSTWRRACRRSTGRSRWADPTRRSSTTCSPAPTCGPGCSPNPTPGSPWTACRPGGM